MRLLDVPDAPFIFDISMNTHSIDPPILITNYKIEKQWVIWDHQLISRTMYDGFKHHWVLAPDRKTKPKFYDSAVYIWLYYHHGYKKPIYIGASDKVWFRLRQEYGIKSGFILEYIEQKCDEFPVHCQDYTPIPKLQCDCIPRLLVQVIKFDELSAWEAEKSLIAQLEPELNRKKYTNSVKYDVDFSGVTNGRF